MIRKSTWLLLSATLLCSGLCSSCTTVQPSNGSQLTSNVKTTVQFVAIKVCGDVTGKQAGAECVDVNRYLWGPVKGAKLIRADSFDSNLTTTLRYKLVAKSGGCFPVYLRPQVEQNYSMDAQFEIRKRGKAIVKITDAHPLIPELLESLKKTRSGFGLTGESPCQAVK